MLKNTCKTVDEITNHLKAGYQAWEQGVFKRIASVLYKTLNQASVPVLGLACMRVQDWVRNDQRYGQFFTLLMDNWEEDANV